MDVTEIFSGKQSFGSDPVTKNYGSGFEILYSFDNDDPDPLRHQSIRICPDPDPRH